MADIMRSATSGYATGAIDTATTQVDEDADPAVGDAQALKINGITSAIVQIETVLGVGTDLKGSKADLVARLGVQVGSDGIIIPIGSIFPYGGSAAPTGWLLCDGSAVSRTTYANLFSVISTTYGSGDGSTTFNVPDLRGRVPIGAGTGTGGGTSGTGLPSGGSALNALSRGSWGGSEDAIVVTHNHGVTDPGHEHVARINSDTLGASSVIGGQGNDTDGVGQNTVSSANITSNTTGVTVDNAGSSGTDQNLQPYMGVNFIIKT